MITIPLYVFLLIYFVFLLIFFLFTGINIYHIFASASFTSVSFVMSMVVIFLTLATFYLTAMLLGGVQWGQTVTLFDLNWLPGIFVQ